MKRTQGRGDGERTDPETRRMRKKSTGITHHRVSLSPGPRVRVAFRVPLHPVPVPAFLATLFKKLSQQPG
jgi:hypothetical protein